MKEQPIYHHSQDNEEKDGRRRKRSQKKKVNMAWRVLKIWGICLAVAAGVLCLFLARKVGTPILAMYVDAEKLVSESSPKTFRSEQTTIIYDSNNEVLKKLKGEKDVYYLSYDQIPDAAKLAIISIEDKKFASHRGVDVIGVGRAVLSLLIHHGNITMGGSTITQQLARNIFLNYEKTYSRKIKEIFIAAALERKYSKDQILEFYLNNVYFANGYYGIEAAAQGYFGKGAGELTISQLAFLCSIPNSPNRYDPYENPEATFSRRDRILKNMNHDGYISDSQYQASIQEDFKVKKNKEKTTNDYAQTYIIRCATEALMRNQGFEFRYQFDDAEDKKRYNAEYDELYDSCRASLYTEGYRIYTSIDPARQQELQTAVTNGLAMFENKTDDGIYEVQGAAVCIDNSNGHVAAIVGGREEDQEGYGLNRAYQSYRQPGSAIKPLLVYTPAFEAGYTPDSMVDDSRMKSENGEKVVSNAGDSYSGEISVRRAVEKSSNVATYRLYQELGSSELLRYLEKLDFKGLEANDYKYDTTSIGGFTDGASTVEMAAGYAALANDGVYRTPTCILRVTDAEGKSIVDEDGVQEVKRVYTINAARMMTDVLTSCVTSRGATARGCQLNVDMPAACKTGTTNENVDGWLCGYTPYFTTVVWVGMDVFNTVENLAGSTYPAEIWKTFMDNAHSSLNLARVEFPSYETVESDYFSDDQEESNAWNQDNEEQDESYNDQDDSASVNDEDNNESNQENDYWNNDDNSGNDSYDNDEENAGKESYDNESDFDEDNDAGDDDSGIDDNSGGQESFEY